MERDVGHTHSRDHGSEDVAMSFTHGKGTRTFINTTECSAFLNSIEQSISREMSETSVFGSAVKTYTKGLRDSTITLSGYWDGATDAIDDVMTATPTGSNILSVCDEGNTINARAMVVATRQTSYQITGTVSDMVAVSAEFQADGTGGSGAYRGVIVAPLVVRGNNSTTAGIDNGASTSNGLVANFHMFNAATSTTIKVQHSTDNATWADLITSQTSSVKFAENKTATGSVNRYLRTLVTTSGSPQILVTAARR